MKLMLKPFRKGRGLTQEDIANEIGSTKRVIGAYERGETPVPLDAACAIADVLHCTLDELAGRRVERTYTDAGQEIVNICYESMNERGKSTLVSVAQSMERDVANRLAKNRDENMEGDAPADDGAVERIA